MERRSRTLGLPYQRGQCAVFQPAGPVNGRRWRLPGTQTRDLRLLKTLKTATVASTPLAIW
jgi:hypothetical protein